MKPNEIYQTITNKIIDLIETHQLSWDKPWISLDQSGEMAHNPQTSNPYRGINQFLLNITTLDREYTHNSWMTYNQIKKQGGHVRRGEKSTPVIFFKNRYFDKNKTFFSDDQMKSMTFKESINKNIQNIPVIKLYRVFNLSAQTEGLDPEYYEFQPRKPMTEWQEVEAIENVIDATRAQIAYKPSNRAYYDISADMIVSPLKTQFKTAHEHGSTILHELGHWSGAKHRLNRTFGKKGTRAYGKEELVAELCSAYTMAALGIEKPITNNAAYLKGWLNILKEDSKAIVQAASKAQAAADYILDGAECASYQKM